MLRQGFCSGFAHMTNAQCINKTCQRGIFRCLQCIENILRRFLRHALQTRQLFHRKLIQIIGGFHQSHINQLLNEFIPQTINIDRTTLSEMHQTLFHLSRANQPTRATRNRLPLFTHNRRTAFRTSCRHDEYPSICWTLFNDAHDHLWNHITRATHHHRVANAHIFAHELIDVV